MHQKFTLLMFAASLACLGLDPIAAQAKGGCTKNDFTGTYAFYEKGSSAVFPPDSQNPSMAPFWAGMFAPFVTVGEVTMKPNGVGEGFFWIRVGSINGGVDPIPVVLEVTEFNDNCTGTFTYSLNLENKPGAETTITERFVLFDNGREFRSIPAQISENGVPYLTWIGEGHRLSKPGELLSTCGPQTAAGSYVSTVENMVQFGPGIPIFSDVLLLRIDVSMNGDYTGALYEKLGPWGNIMLPASGTVKVNPDCSYESTLNVTTTQGQSLRIGIRGVYFDQGKKYYGLQVSSGGTLFSFGQGERITP